MSPYFLAMLATLGLATGFLAGLLGIGGGMLLVPFLAWAFTASDFPSEHVLHMAVATSLATILFTSISSIRSHHGRGSVRWDVVRSMAPGAFAGTFVGAQFASRLGTRGLALFFALFIGYSGVNMMRKAHRPPARIGGPLPSHTILFSVGTGVGFVASLLGAGGAFLLIPYLQWRGVQIREAVGSSAALGFAIATGGLVGYVVAGIGVPGLPPYTLGFIDLPALVCCAVASFITAPIGVRIAHGLKGSTLKMIFATLLVGLATSMAWKAWQS
jgi:uncharacterized membrane protein YfcA